MARHERGSQSIELALNILPFFGIIFLIISIAWAIFTKASLQHAVAEGVRYAITSQTLPNKGQDESIKKVVQNNAMGLLNGGNLGMVTIQYYAIDPVTGNLTPTMNNIGGNIVEVSVEAYSANPLTPILAWGKGVSSGRPKIGFSVRASDRMESSPGGIPPKR